MPQRCPYIPGYAYHATTAQALPRIARAGLRPRVQPVCRRDEDRCTKERVLFFSLRPQDALAWGDVLLRFPEPAEASEDAYGDTVMDTDGSILRTAYFTPRGVEPAQMEICQSGRWTPLPKKARK